VENDNPERRPGSGLTLVAFLLIALGLFLFVFYPHSTVTNPDHPLKPPSTDHSYEPLYPEHGIRLNELLKLGRQDNEHEDLLSQIREDLKIPQGLEVKIFVGPYANISSEGRIVDSNHPFGFILLLDEWFYRDLTPEEKIALISHELGHLTNEAVFLMYSSDTLIRFQIEADTYATKYAKPEAMISVINKVNAKHGGLPSRQYDLRIQNLEKIKQSRQER